MQEMGNVPDEECLHLGMTFSFPVEQTALGAGRLLTWTKGFSATGAIGNDVVQLLQDALDKKRVQCKCVALVNDVGRPWFISFYISDIPFVDRRHSLDPWISNWVVFPWRYLRDWNKWCLCRRHE
jgi:hexokinase